MLVRQWDVARSPTGLESCDAAERLACSFLLRLDERERELRRGLDPLPAQREAIPFEHGHDLVGR